MSRYYAIDKGQVTGITFEVAGRCKPIKGSKIILFKRSGEEIEFTEEAEVTAPDSWPADQENFAKLCQIGEVSPLEGERPLSGLSGSLQKTRYFLEPERHFRSAITALSYDDYKTILSGQIYWSRSIYRLVFHSMPISLRARFVSENTALFPKSESQFRRVDYRQLAPKILDFYESRFRMGLELLAMVQNSYPSEIDGVPDMKQLYMSAELGDGTGFDHISVGQTIVSLLGMSQSNLALRGLLVENQVGFDGAGDGSNSTHNQEKFVDQARQYLADSNQEFERKRKWQDLIF